MERYRIAYLDNGEVSLDRAKVATFIVCAGESDEETACLVYELGLSRDELIEHIRLFEDAVEAGLIGEEVEVSGGGHIDLESGLKIRDSYMFGAANQSEVEWLVDYLEELRSKGS